MKRPRKYDYLYVLQGYYHGWEDLCAAPQTWEGLKEMRANRKDYQENERGSYRIIKRREERAIPLQEIIDYALATA